MRAMMKRELRVAFSRRAQPMWFRVAKWVVFAVLVMLFWRRPTFWWIAAAAFVAGMGLHLFYRYKTRGWTRAWGGWDDLQAGRVEP
jgi:hypothetical protein